MLHHSFDDSYLLPVFFSKICLVRFYNVKQSAYHLANSIEMSRAMSTFHHSRHWRIFKMPFVGRRVHFLNRRRKHIIGSAVLQKFAVGFKGAGVVFQVVLVVELCWIDKNRNHSYIILRNASSHKRGVSFMQSTHGRNESHVVASFAFVKQNILQFCYFIKYNHLCYTLVNVY